MSEIGRHGRTVLYVSHDLGSITRLCPRAIWLQDGSSSRRPATDVVASYLDRDEADPCCELSRGDDPRALSPRLRSVTPMVRFSPALSATSLRCRPRYPSPSADPAWTLLSRW